MLSAATLESATARIRSPSGVKILDQAAKIALEIRGETNEMSQSNKLMIQFTITHLCQSHWYWVWGLSLLEVGPRT